MTLKWIHVRDELPEPGQRVLCCDTTPSRDRVSPEVLFTAALEECDEDVIGTAWAHYIDEKCYTFREVMSSDTWTVNYWMPLIPIPAKPSHIKDSEESNRFEMMDL